MSCHNPNHRLLLLFQKTCPCDYGKFFLEPHYPTRLGRKSKDPNKWVVRYTCLQYPLTGNAEVEFWAEDTYGRRRDWKGWRSVKQAQRYFEGYLSNKKNLFLSHTRYPDPIVWADPPIPPELAEKAKQNFLRPYDRRVWALFHKIFKKINKSKKKPKKKKK